MRLSGNTIIITGGSSGIGLALAERFLALHNRVIITGRDIRKLEYIKSIHPEMDIFCCDLAQESSLRSLTDFLTAHYRGLNILINNAGVQYNYSFVEGTGTGIIDKIDYEVSANVLAPLKLTAGLLPLLMRNPGSAVVNVSSGLYIAPKRSAPVYCATKAALHSFSQTLRYQLEGSGTKVFEIVPALVDTPMTHGRGKDKIPPQALVDVFIRDFADDRFESHIGKVKWLRLINRIAPRLAAGIMKNG